ncbi:MAG: thiazole synthase [Myxococcota bacterium]
MSGPLTIGPLTLTSRLLVGTGRYRDYEQMKACHEASGTELVTVALRRVDVVDGASILDFVDRGRIALLPNTSGCFTPEDAITTAHLARELLGTPLLKLEVLGDDHTLWPDVEGTLEAARVLVRDGFVVLPYCTDDPVVCRRLQEIGCAAVMPLAAPIGSGLGIRNPTNLRLVREAVSIPLIVDAGIGTASDAALAMELGADAVLLNTAIAGATDPVAMAHAMKHAVIAGRLAFEAGRMERRLYATASSPLDGRLGS